ncbi:hypothetical protein EIP91_004064 [Steccherinum ochraceum]|uniref:F-box domain-containing protein n=1 Tax=Steccherinum ochraceum TaxID=92696 RepID=A0A4R0R9G8_9APHY|nr:hypothetical protein EIP91_004064 [Steccherinum ochraceum]
MATILSLPNELLIDIFSYVASDVRKSHVTATLSPVCKIFHRVIQSSGIDVMYTPLRGIDRMQRFLDLVQDRELSQKRVYSLLLVVAGIEDEDTTEDTLALSMFETILSTIDASRLHTLFIYVPFAKDETPVLQLSVPLHALTDLHLSGLLAVSPAGHPPHTPNLERVQLLRLYRLPPEAKDFPRFIHNLAPRLTQLKLSMLSPPESLMHRISQFDDSVTRNVLHAKALYHKFPTSLRQIVASFTYQRGDAITLMHLIFRAREEAPAVEVTTSREGQLDHIPGSDEEDGVEAARIDGFALEWKSVSSGEESS